MGQPHDVQSDLDEHDEMAQIGLNGGQFIMDVLKFKKQAPKPNVSEVIQRMAEKVTRMDEQESDATFDSVLQSQAKKLQTSKSAGKVDVLKKYIWKCKKSSVDDLLFEILKEGDPAELRY